MDGSTSLRKKTIKETQVSEKGKRLQDGMNKSKRWVATSTEGTAWVCLAQPTAEAKESRWGRGHVFEIQ